MQDALLHARKSWLKAYYDGDVQQLARWEHPQFQWHDQLSGEIETPNRYPQIAFAVSHQTWKPARWHTTNERFQFSDGGMQCLITADVKQLALQTQAFWLFEHEWRMVQLVFKPSHNTPSAPPTNHTPSHSQATGRL